MTETIKSTITCDMEGRIETFNKGAEEIFRYRPEEVIGKKRVSLFSPGLVVLEHVPTWLKIASEKGEYKGRTVFLRKDGTPFAADVRITPTFREGKQTGFCGVTEPRPDIDVNKAYPQVALFTKIFGALVVTRAPFLTATLMPVLIGAAWRRPSRGACSGWWCSAPARCTWPPTPSTTTLTGPAARTRPTTITSCRTPAAAARLSSA